MTRTARSSVRWVSIAAAFLIVGCNSQGPTASIYGTVTLDGAPLERGTITFTSVDSGGAICSGVISRGQYSVDNVLAGKNRVEVQATSSAPSGSGADSGARPTYEEAMRRQQEMRNISDAAMKKKMDKQQLKQKADEMRRSLVTQETIGNNQVMEIGAGRQNKDFNLMTPRK